MSKVPAFLGKGAFSGWVIRQQSGFFYVQTSQGMVVCHLRGRLKQGPMLGDIAAVGDRVQIDIQSDGSGTIEQVEPRRDNLVEYWCRAWHAGLRLNFWRLNPIALAWNFARDSRQAVVFFLALLLERY